MVVMFVTLEGDGTFHPSNSPRRLLEGVEVWIYYVLRPADYNGVRG
jgi:hypothetical protein